MPKITAAIPQHNYELVRDRICQILADELPNQATLLGAGYEYIGAPVWMERTVAVDKVELSVVNVYLNRIDYDHKDYSGHRSGICTYYIDVYANSKYEEQQDGTLMPADELAGVRMQRLCGIVQYILDNPVYKTLDFQPAHIGQLHVANLQLAEANNPQNATVTQMGRVELSVKVGENVDLLDAPMIGTYITQVKLYNTEKGYLWSNDPDAILEETGDEVTDENGNPTIPEAPARIKISEFETAAAFDADSVLTGLVPDGNGGFVNKNFTALQLAGYLSGDNNWVVDELLTGIVDGSNATFTTAHDFEPGSIQVKIARVPMFLVDDYINIGTNTIQFTRSPLVGEEPRITYLKRQN